MHRVTGKTLVETVDELIYFMAAETWNDIPFDPVTCDSWHLYVADHNYSLREAGGKVCAIGLEIYHASTGNFDISLGRALSRLGKKHKNRKYLYMTCAEFRNTRMNRAKHILSYLKHVIHQKVNLNKKVPVGHG